MYGALRAYQKHIQENHPCHSIFDCQGSKKNPSRYNLHFKIDYLKDILLPERRKFKYK